MKLLSREDGSFIVTDDPNGPYHVVSRDIDPYNKYDIQDVAAYATAHPEDVEEEKTVVFPSYREAAVRQVEELHPKILEHGFMFGGVRIQADTVAQQNANGFLTAISSGIPVPLPIEWRTKANLTYLIESVDDFKLFAGTMLSYVQTVFHKTWKAKDDIRASTTYEQVDELLEEYTENLQ